MDKSFFVIAHNIRSLFNVGSIFRTSDAFGVTKIFLTGYTGKPPDSKIAKVALGAENSVAWEHKASAVRVIAKLRKEYPGITIVGLENNVPMLSSGSSVGAGLKPAATLLQKYQPRLPLALVLGEEVSGIPKPILKLCDQFVEIPMQGQKESLNVSVAFGVAAYAIRNRR